MPAFNLSIPFSTADGLYGKTFSDGLTSFLTSITEAVAAPALACVTLWIIVQGVLVMRGDLDIRRGIGRILKTAIVFSLVISASDYTGYVQNTFTETVPTFIAGVTNGGVAGLELPNKLDIILDLCEAEFQVIASEISPTNQQDQAALHTAEFILFGTLWSVFAIYEVSIVMTDLLLAIGPLILLGYLFDATKGIADRWIGQLITYALLLLLVLTVSSIVITIETKYLTAQLALITLIGPAAGQIMSFYDMDIFLLTGDAFVLALPTIAGLLGGGLSLQPGESLGRLGQAGFRQAAAAPRGPAAGAAPAPGYGD